MVTDDYLAAIAPTTRPNPTPWTRAQDKVFEQGLVVFPEETPNRWARIAEHVGKTASEVREHYEALLHDVSQIDSGHVDLPIYPDESYLIEDAMNRSGETVFGSGKRKGGENTERKKGVPWTEEEHRLFLVGLQKYGKGDWRSISRNAVVSRTPTQVASHAQKYYLRLNSGKKEKKRSSIHDMTTDQNEPNWGDPSSSGPPVIKGQPRLVNEAYLQQTGQGSYGYQHLGYPM